MEDRGFCEHLFCSLSEQIANSGDVVPLMGKPTELPSL